MFPKGTRTIPAEVLTTNRLLSPPGTVPIIKSVRTKKAQPRNAFLVRHQLFAIIPSPGASCAGFFLTFGFILPLQGAEASSPSVGWISSRTSSCRGTTIPRFTMIS